MDFSPLKEYFSRLRSHWLHYFLLIVILFIGAGVRLINLDNPPLDFHSWRQLRSLSIARGLYFELTPEADPELRATAILLGRQFEKLEPTILEGITAATYKVLGQEVPFVPRLYSILFWTIGGVGVFLILRHLLSPGSALVGTAVYMLLEFGVVASRSFQPDPFMVMWIILTVYALIRFGNRKTWLWAILTGLFGGLAILVKVFAVFPVAVCAIVTAVTVWGVRGMTREPKLWTAAAIMACIPAIYYIFLSPGAGGNYLSSWGVGFWNLWFEPTFYQRWLSYLNRLYGIHFVILAFLSQFLGREPRFRLFTLSLWLGYFLYGMMVPSLIITHSYYNLMLAPILAFSIAPLAEKVFGILAEYPKRWRVVPLSVLFLWLLYAGFLQSNVVEHQENYRNEPERWQRIGAAIPAGSSVIGITQDYGASLNYYGWRVMTHWLSTADHAMNVLGGGNYDPNDPVLEQVFAERTAGKQYFLVTDFTELDRQPVIQRLLYENYAYVEGEDYILFDLTAR